MDNPKLVETKVGIFVVVSTVVCLGFFIFLGGEKTLFSGKSTLHIKAAETGGLFIGSVVQLAGIPVGNVSQIKFDNSSNQLVIDLTIDKRFMTRLTEGSKIEFKTQGALGDKFISILPGSWDAVPLKDGDFIEVDVPADLFTTLGKSGNKIEKAFEILDQIDKIVRELNTKKVASNLGETAFYFKKSSESLDQILGSLKGPDPKNNKLKKSLDHLASILEKIDKGQGSLGGLINDPTVHEDLKSILGGAKRNKLLKYLIRQTIQKGEEEEEKPKK